MKQHFCPQSHRSVEFYINKTGGEYFFQFFLLGWRKKEEDITEKSSSKVILVLKHFAISPESIGRKFNGCESNSQQCYDLKSFCIKSLP